MKKFLKNIALFILVFFLIDKILYIFLLTSPSLEKDKRLEKIITGEMNKDILIFGSSRGARNVLAKQIQDSLNLSAFNLSYPGSNIVFHEFLIKSVLEFNEKPKTILLVMDDSDQLKNNPSISFRFDRLYPLSRYPYINDELIKKNEKTILSKFLISSRINKRNFDLRKKHFSKFDSLRSDGSMPLYGNKFKKINYEKNNTYSSNNELPEKVRALKSIHSICKKNNIKLILVFPPNFYSHNPQFEERIKSLSNNSSDLFVYNTSKTSLYKNQKYFYDAPHLNIKGAVIFTNELIEMLKKKI